MRISFIILIVFFILAADFYSKEYVKSLFNLHNENKFIICDLFNISYVENYGITFGLFSNNGKNVDILIFLNMATIILISVLFFYIRKKVNYLYTFCFSLIIGGGLGNLIDRMQNKFVFDFLEFHYKHYYYPAFNFADAAIVLGVIYIFFFEIINKNYE